MAKFDKSIGVIPSTDWAIDGFFSSKAWKFDSNIKKNSEEKEIHGKVVKGINISPTINQLLVKLLQTNKIISKQAKSFLRKVIHPAVPTENLKSSLMQ